eukprot:5123530-Lingulodinium_polyedra.AAC.1
MGMATGAASSLPAGLSLGKLDTAWRAVSKDWPNNWAQGGLAHELTAGAGGRQGLHDPPPHAQPSAHPGAAEERLAAQAQAASGEAHGHGRRHAPRPWARSPGSKEGRWRKPGAGMPALSCMQGSLDNGRPHQGGL